MTMLYFIQKILRINLCVVFLKSVSIQCSMNLSLSPWTMSSLFVLFCLFSRLSREIVLFRFSTDSMDDIRGIHGQCLGGFHGFPGHSADGTVRLFI